MKVRPKTMAYPNVQDGPDNEVDDESLFRIIDPVDLGCIRYPRASIPQSCMPHGNSPFAKWGYLREPAGISPDKKQYTTLGGP